MKRQFKSAVLVIMAILILPCCAGLKKMQTNAGDIRFKASPEIMETHAGNVEISFNGHFPQLYFDKKATLTATPVIRYAGGETPLKPVLLQGEKVLGNNRIITYDAGGNFTYQEKFAYKESMRSSDLVVQMKAVRGSKSVDLEPVIIAKGILALNTLMAVTPKTIIGIRREANNSGQYNPDIDPFQRIVPDELLADIKYLINSAILRTEEATAPDVRTFLDYTKDAHQDDRKEVKKVEVTAYASPDGSLDLNTELASKREKSSTAFVEEELKKARVEANLRTRYTPEDWEGFREMMEQSNIQDKDLILRVLSMHTDPEVREREIKNLSAAFTQIAEEVLPKLRRAKLLTSVNIIGKSDEEIVAIAESTPGALNPAELLYAASLTEDQEKQLKLYQAFSQVYPDDWRGPNNAGVVLARQMKYAEAKPLFEKAEKLRSDEPVIQNNLGAIALFNNDVDAAEKLFGTASGSGNEVNYNLGLVNIRKGDYNKANQFFRSEADPNTALVKVISGNYNGALSDLEEYDKPDCFLKEYLKAVIGARTGQESLLFDSLRKAISYNPAMKRTAATEMEFRKYFDDSRFRAIVE